MNSLARLPSGVYDWMAARSMSPVEICGISKTRGQPLRLRPLARARGPEQQKVLTQRPAELRLLSC